MPHSRFLSLEPPVSDWLIISIVLGSKMRLLRLSQSAPHIKITMDTSNFWATGGSTMPHSRFLRLEPPVFDWTIILYCLRTQREAPEAKPISSSYSSSHSNQQPITIQYWWATLTKQFDWLEVTVTVTVTVTAGLLLGFISWGLPPWILTCYLRVDWLYQVQLKIIFFAQ